MSFVTFVRDYIQDPDRIIHIPNFVFDAFKEFFLYIFSFQWFRNLTYVTLYKPSPEQSSALYGPSAANSSIQNHVSEGAANYLSQNTNQIESFLNDGSWLSTYLPAEQLSFFHNSLYGFFNGFSSTFHFCAVTILIIHILLNEDFSRAFKIALASCFGDLSCMVAVLFGKRELIIPWLALEPLGYIVGFGIQFFFALEIIKDNRRIKANFDKVRQFSEPLLGRRSSSPNSVKAERLAKYPPNLDSKGINLSQLGKLSYNRWIIPLLILFSWCEQTQFFQTMGVFALQPTATLLEIPGLAKPLQISVYLLTFIATRILVTWFCLLIFQRLVDFSVKTASRRTFVPSKTFGSTLTNLGFVRRAYNLLIRSNKQEIISFIKNKFLKIYNNLISLVYNVRSWFIPKSLQNGTKNRGPAFNEATETTSSVTRSEVALQNNEIYIKGKQLQHFLSDPLAIAAVTYSLAFLPAYSTNLLITKSIGFFPDENRVKHSLFSPWDMPATILASDMDFISNHPNLAEYPFFLPFYDKGDYGGWLGVGEEDIRYGPFRLWQSRRIRAPWRRTTLQEPALTFANDKSLFINPLHRTPDLKENYDDVKAINKTSQSFTIEKLDLQSTANIKAGPFVGPIVTNSYPTSLRQGFTTPKAGETRPDRSFFEKSPNYLPSKKAELPINEAQPTPQVALHPKERTITKQSINQKWKYLWSQLKNQSAYTKLLAINYTKPSTLESNGAATNLDSPLPSSRPNSLQSREGKAALSAEKLAKLSRAVLHSTTQGNSTADAQQKPYRPHNFLPLNQSVLDKSFIKKKERPQGDETSAPLDVKVNGQPFGETLIREQTIIKAENSKITKAGTKKLVEVLKKPLRKIKTSSFLYESKDTSLPNFRQASNGIKQPSTYESFFGEKHSTISKENNATRAMQEKPSPLASLTRFINRLQIWPYAFTPNFLQSREGKTGRNYSLTPLSRSQRSSTAFGGANVEAQIKDNKQIRKRFKKFKKKLRFFRTRAYKKRNTKIKRLKHFHYIKNKNKKRRKSRRLIYKLRRQYPYIRNIKERKADIFGLYSSVNSPKGAQLLYDETSTEKGTAFYVPSTTFSTAEGNNKWSTLGDYVQNYKDSSLGDVLGAKLENKKINFKEKALYSTEYPKKKGSINIKKDFNLIFRTQIGERLDFAQEEIRARVFMNPYVHYLLNNRIDHFASRSSEMAKPAFYKLQSMPSNYTTSSKIKENDLFKRRLIISKYADAVDFLKPSPRHSYIDRVYNHQFKGTLSTARRLFSLKIQYDRPLVHPLNYKPAIEHEGLNDRVLAPKASERGFTLPKAEYPKSYALESTIFPKENLGEAQNSDLLQKGCSSPLYASWDPDLRKLILTNRYLNYKTITTVGASCKASATSNVKPNSLEEKFTPNSYIEDKDPNKSRLSVDLKVNPKAKDHSIKAWQKGENQEGRSQSNPKLAEGSYKDQENNATESKGGIISFTNWPLKEPYFKDNEFLVSQLYSNSQPIDSFLSQENEKARPAALPRRVSSFNTVLYSKNNVQPTDAQRSQQFLKLESNDKKTFLFKHLWNSSNTASGLQFRPKVNPLFSSYTAMRSKGESKQQNPLSKNQTALLRSPSFSAPGNTVPISVEQRKANRMEEREYPLWMVLKSLPPNQGGFLWPGD